MVFALDRLTKWIVESNVSRRWTPCSVIPGFFNIVHSENRGVAFGIFNDSTIEWRTTLLVVAVGGGGGLRGGHAVERAAAGPLFASGV